MITSACMTREPDAKGLAKLIASKVGFNRILTVYMTSF